MKALMASTALVTGLAFGSATMASAEKSELFMNESTGTELHASEFIGMNVYSAETDSEINEVTGIQDDWNDVGEISDIVLNRDGNVQAVLVDLGGFLGVGERQVAMNMDAIRMVSDTETEDPNDFFLVISAAQADLENAPEYEADREWTMGKRPLYTRDKFEMASLDNLTTEKLTGAYVYDANDEWIGEVDRLIITDTGELTQAIVDVGGFLGLGEKPVAINIKDMEIMRRGDSDDLRVYLSKTEAELEQMPTFDQ